MINILDKHNCCGCSACVQVCPKQCISFEEDEYGFRYPLVDKTSCIDCDLCEKVCPCLDQGKTTHKPIKVYAAINTKEEIRMKSSSGGIFTMLAETVLDEGGIVFGARFDENWEVMHSYTETKEGLEAFRGSKYVQSRIGETYKQVRGFLNVGRKVLFSGTSCQIAGLKKFLRKEYDNLLTVDVVCHGVPSPLVWREYLKELIKRPQGVVGKNTVSLSLKDMSVITGISFRDKSTGWKKYGFVVHGQSAFKVDENSVLPSVKDEILLHETLDKNLFMQVFLKNLCLRPSCYNCPTKGGRCESDFTIADFWNVDKIHPNYYDDRGTSLILAYSESSVELLKDYCKRNDIRLLETEYQNALISNSCIEHCVEENEYISLFWKSFMKDGISSVKWAFDELTPSLFYRIKRKIKRTIKQFFG